VTVKVIAPLVTSLTLSSSSVSVGSSVQATLTATSGSFGSSFIHWGDGTTSNGPVASHIYAAPGTYTIMANAADALKAVSSSATVNVQ
jgi:PKD repeat protein